MVSTVWEAGLQVGEPGTLSHLIVKVIFPFAASDCVGAGEMSWNVYPAGAAPCARVYEPIGSLGYACVTPLPLCGAPLPVSVHPGALTLLPVAKSTEFTVTVPVPGTAAVTVTEQFPVLPLESVTVAFPVPGVPNVVLKLAPAPPDGGAAFGDADQEEYEPLPPAAVKVTDWFTGTLIKRVLQVGELPTTGTVRVTVA